MCTRPHSGVYLQEKLDVIFTSAAFDQQVTLVFLDDGVFQLKKGQQPNEFKDTAAMMNALEIYDVNDIYIEIESLQDRGLKASDLSLPLKEINRREVNNFLKQYDVVMSG